MNHYILNKDILVCWLCLRRFADATLVKNFSMLSSIILGSASMRLSLNVVMNAVFAGMIEKDSDYC